MSAARSLFITQVYEASLAAERGFEPLNGELQDACLMLAEEDRAGRDWCKRQNYGGYTSYASLDDLPRRMTVFDDLGSDSTSTPPGSPRPWPSTWGPGSSRWTACGSMS